MSIYGPENYLKGHAGTYNERMQYRQVKALEEQNKLLAKQTKVLEQQRETQARAQSQANAKRYVEEFHKSEPMSDYARNRQNERAAERNAREQEFESRPEQIAKRKAERKAMLEQFAQSKALKERQIKAEKENEKRQNILASISIPQFVLLCVAAVSLDLPSGSLGTGVGLTCFLGAFVASMTTGYLLVAKLRWFGWLVSLPVGYYLSKLILSLVM